MLGGFKKKMLSMKINDSLTEGKNEWILGKEKEKEGGLELRKRDSVENIGSVISVNSSKHSLTTCSSRYMKNQRKMMIGGEEYMRLCGLIPACDDASIQTFVHVFDLNTSVGCESIKGHILFPDLPCVAKTNVKGTRLLVGYPGSSILRSQKGDKYGENNGC
jgi:hypothetical protein